ncbi:MAG: oligosaccharide flippase family protein [Candidatus Falkowbacteria bacterium]
MQRKKVFKNAIMSVIQIVTISIVFFVLYRFLLKVVGVEQIGIWSLVIATTSITQIANFGLSASIVKFVAKYIAKEEEQNALIIIQTAAVSIAFFVSIILLISYPILKWVLSFVIPSEFLALSFSLLPFMVVSFWIMSITSIFHAGLDGCQRFDLRSSIIMGTSVFDLILAFILAPTFGLLGLAFARLIQNFIVLFASWFLLRRQFLSAPIIPCRWDKKIFKEIVNYGINFQIMSVAVLSYDFITKALLSRFGGLFMVGYYEMASKMIQQLRMVIISAAQVLVPVVAELKERVPKEINNLYLTLYQIIFYLSLPLYSLIIIFSPSISELWIGHYEKIFIIFTIILSLGWFLNMLAVPAYFINLGIGDLKWVTIGYLLMVFLSVFLGFIFGAFYGGTGVVIAISLSLFLSSSVIYFAYHVKNKIPLIKLLPKSSRMLALACSLDVLATFVIYKNISSFFTFWQLNILISLLFFIIVFFPLWRHSMRRLIFKWIFVEFLNRDLNKKTTQWTK